MSQMKEATKITKEIDRLKAESVYLMIANNDGSFFKGDTQGFVNA